MFRGDIVTIIPNGVVVREKALQPLGIYDESICRGLWAANPHRLHQHRGHPNLIISPFHPSSWPFLIRIRLILENRQGALAEASGLLEQNDLPIVFAECTPTGFTHATWTVIAESTWGELERLRQRKQVFDSKNPTVRLPNNKVNEAVGRAIKRCDAFLQVLYADKDKTPARTKFRWLNKEYEIAVQASLKIIRLGDTVKAPYEWWKARDEFHEDHYPKGFRTDVSDLELSEEIRKAVKEIAKKLGIQ
jgi:hypothetical protein